MSGDHTDVGAYALGLLERQDRQAFEDHLAGCHVCRAELPGLSGMKELFSGIGPVGAGTDGPPGQRLPNPATGAPWPGAATGWQ